MITIYTDGSCLKNPGGAGGWAFCLIEEDGIEYYMSDGENISTNNTMELTAVIVALSCLTIGLECKIFSDSMLVINCATGKWKRKANQDLWNEYEKVSFDKKIEFFLSATIYCNKDGILNDDIYDYETIGFPFMKNLGQLIYGLESKRSRKIIPDLSPFIFEYDK